MAEKINNLDHYILVSGLIDYPDDGFLKKIENIQQFLDEKYHDLGTILSEFTDYSNNVSLDTIQELHTRSFEVQAITTLDIGYLLFGDDYKRAELLVNLNREHQEAGNDCGNELADHLPNVLRLLPKLKDEELREELIQKLIHPGLKKMIREFDPRNLEKKNEVYKRHHKTLIDFPDQFGTIYQKPLKVLMLLFEHDFNIDTSSDEKTSDFLGSIDTEMKIEG